MLYSGNYLMFIRSEEMLDKLMKRVESQVQLYAVDYGQFYTYFVKQTNIFIWVIFYLYFTRIRIYLSRRLPCDNFLQSRSFAPEETIRAGEAVPWDYP